MHDEKKRRLRAKGWKVGTTKDFLGLTAGEEALIDLRLRLAEALRARRLRSRITQGSLARMLHSSQSRVAKIEAGESNVSIDLLVRAMLATGAKPREVGAAIAAGK